MTLPSKEKMFEDLEQKMALKFEESKNTVRKVFDDILEKLSNELSEVENVLIKEARR